MHPFYLHDLSWCQIRQDNKLKTSAAKLFKSGQGAKRGLQRLQPQTALALLFLPASSINGRIPFQDPTCHYQRSEIARVFTVPRISKHLVWRRIQNQRNMLKPTGIPQYSSLFIFNHFHMLSCPRNGLNSSLQNRHISLVPRYAKSAILVNFVVIRGFSSTLQMRVLIFSFLLHQCETECDFLLGFLLEERWKTTSKLVADSCGRM